ncbi:glycosyl transferase family 39 [Komarekiella sp. 'clone 1']|uniref:Glycosyl transferase family 39 n=1 Tax=Komarekiella delphini-convector SJRDD-AB1 TaxID=2593771 RepID=A0AA40SX42_9NOST|nr:glycosyltransferase family 39 protein [Komarekiella delphini-convector]MBD6616659.1 glycosyl transferase family 39 [Komarekiella delphini-convector SJRDD-AB1]
MRHPKLSPSWLRFFIVLLLVLGVFFRFFNLDYKIYWHDEVYTSFRAAGFTGKEIGEEIFQNQIISPQELQKYQRLKPGSTPVDTIKSLAVEDPQHPPLYFLMARFWMQAFGSSRTASRTLPALLSLLSLVSMYALGRELFTSRIAALLATALLALSPFDILFAQIARQYSFLTVCVIASSFFLLRALRLPTWYNWGLYALAVTLGLYSQPFFGLTLSGHIVYVLLARLLVKNSKVRAEDSHNLPVNQNKFSISNLIFFGLAIATSLILYTPWLFVLKSNYQRVLDTTSWVKGGDILYRVKLWILSFTALFLDLDFGFNNIWTYIPRLLIILLIAAAIYQCRYTSRKTWLFILTAIFVPFLMLAVSDFFLETQRSAVSRYLISSFPGVQLAVGYLLATKILNRQRFWRGVMVVLISCSVVSCTVSAFSDTWWSNIPSHFNAEMARRVNAVSSPILLSDGGYDGTNLGDILSLSYLLDSDVQLVLFGQPPKLEISNVKSLLSKNSETFLFRPSPQLVQAIESKYGQLVQIVPAGGLWQLKRL